MIVLDKEFTILGHTLMEFPAVESMTWSYQQRQYQRTIDAASHGDSPKEDYTALKESRHHQDFASQVCHTSSYLYVWLPTLNNGNVVIGEPDPIARNFSLLSPPLNDNFKAEQDSFIKTCTMVEMAHLVYFDSAPHESDDNYHETKLSGQFTTFATPFADLLLSICSSLTEHGADRRGKQYSKETSFCSDSPSSSGSATSNEQKCEPKQEEKQGPNQGPYGLLTRLDEDMDVDMAGEPDAQEQLLLTAAPHASHLPPAEPQYMYPDSSGTVLSADVTGEVSAHEYVYDFRQRKVRDVATPIGNKTNDAKLHDKFVQYMRESEPKDLEHALAPFIGTGHFAYHPVLLELHGMEADNHFGPMTRDEMADDLPVLRESVCNDYLLRFTSYTCKANQKTSTDSNRSY
ncbi:uncharacterized protein FIESC28_05577 [Fusarium coffeatum]|uniref:Uncharacterized protein n=1 Tax=Fusarium coffeatum TaxID=231269 RepID=A0A366RQS8_9HYPO|nr:uncharacterized protein FIESC28_05577 [Fusarium coffeatum]RBR19467.1 hypothetical protein FIESC28_05577 [Fusarium coffeatum]